MEEGHDRSGTPPLHLPSSIIALPPSFLNMQDSIAAVTQPPTSLSSAFTYSIPSLTTIAPAVGWCSYNAAPRLHSSYPMTGPNTAPCMDDDLIQDIEMSRAMQVRDGSSSMHSSFPFSHSSLQGSAGCEATQGRAVFTRSVMDSSTHYEHQRLTASVHHDIPLMRGEDVSSTAACRWSGRPSITNLPPGGDVQGFAPSMYSSPHAPLSNFTAEIFSQSCSRHISSAPHAFPPSVGRDVTQDNGSLGSCPASLLPRGASMGFDYGKSRSLSQLPPPQHTGASGWPCVLPDDAPGSSTSPGRLDFNGDLYFSSDVEWKSTPRELGP